MMKPGDDAPAIARRLTLGGVKRADDRRVIRGIVHVQKMRLSLVRLSAQVLSSDTNL